MERILHLAMSFFAPYTEGLTPQSSAPAYCATSRGTSS